MAKAAAKPSPFAPARLPDLPVVPGVRLAACEAGIRYKGRTDLMLAVLDPGTDGGRRAHPLQDLLGARAVVPRQPAGTARRARWSSTPATPMPSPARRAARPTRMTAEAAGQGRRLRRRARSIIASTGVIGEPLDAGKFAHLLDGPRQVGQGRRVRDRPRAPS